MNAATSENRARLGFLDGDRGAHSHATLMVRDLDVIFAATEPSATPADYARVVLDDNALGKRTAAARKHTLNNLTNLYAMNPAVPLFRIFRELWAQEAEGRPMLALLCALARDPLLRASVDVVLDVPSGTPLSSLTLAGTVTRPLTDATKRAIGTRMLSSWAQAGFLDSPRRRIRRRPGATPAATAYALALGFMEGGRGALLLSTRWTRLLDCPADAVQGLVRQAARCGWVEYRAAGDVVDLRVDRLFSDEERGWCDGQ
jgi:hypothetical protein